MVNAVIAAAFDNFGGTLPVVYHDAYRYGIEGAANDYVMQTSPEQTNSSTTRNEVRLG